MAYHNYITEASDQFDIIGLYPPIYDAPSSLRQYIKVGDWVDVRVAFPDHVIQRCTMEIIKENRQRLLGIVHRTVYDKQSAHMASWENASSWRCEECDFDVCDVCYACKFLKRHPHPLVYTPVPKNTWAYCNGDRCVKLRDGVKVSVKRSSVFALWATSSKNGMRIYKRARQ